MYGIIKVAKNMKGCGFMKNFYNYMRHLQLINWHICRYSLKALHCQVNDDFFLPSVKHHTEEYFFNNSSSECPMPKEFPEVNMGGYEYSCCVEYLKNLRTTLFKHGLQTKYKLEFSEIKNNLTSDLILCPLENCLFTVARQCGFKVIEQVISETVQIYTLSSNL